MLNGHLPAAAATAASQAAQTSAAEASRKDAERNRYGYSHTAPPGVADSFRLSDRDSEPFTRSSTDPISDG